MDLKEIAKQQRESYEQWSQKCEEGADPYEVMTPLVAHYLLTSRSISIQICWSELREHPVFALLCIEDPSLLEL